MADGRQRMKATTLVVALIALLVAIPSKLMGKNPTTRIVIEGADLTKRIEITDHQILVFFNVWTGPGTFSTQPGFDANAPSFIVDWSLGPVPEPHALRKYQVS